MAAKEVFMKNTFKLIGIIAFVVIIGFSFPSCGDSDSSSGGNETNEKAVYTSIDSEGNVYELTITKNSDKTAYAPKTGDLFKLVITLVNGIMKTSEGTVTDEVKSGSTMTITLTVSGSASFSISVSNDKDEASAIKEINGSIPITESSDGDTSSVDVSDSPLVPYVPVLLTPDSLASYLATLPTNTASTAYYIKLKVTSSKESVTIQFALNGEPNKYVKLDLTGSTITSFDNADFANCTSLTSVTIPDTITRIGSATFIGCTSLTNVIIPDSVTSIGGLAFFDCKSLISIIIPDSVTSIGSVAFDHCESLTSVIIGNGLTSIERGTFADCISITSLTIGSGVTSIGESAFVYCNSITSVTFKGTIPSSGFRPSGSLYGSLLSKFYETDKDNGTPGTYTRRDGD
jgi:hypothetical protein